MLCPQAGLFHNGETANAIPSFIIHNIFARPLPPKLFCHSNSSCLSQLRLHALNQGFWTEGEREKVKVTQSCPILCDPMDYAFHGVLQARILEWAAFPFCRESSQPRDQTQVSRIAGRLFFTSWATKEVQEYWSG